MTIDWRGRGWYAIDKSKKYHPIDVAHDEEDMFKVGKIAIESGLMYPVFFWKNTVNEQE